MRTARIGRQMPRSAADHPHERPGVAAANARRNAASEGLSPRWRWRGARTALWDLLDRHVGAGAAVAVVGAGNGHDLPLRRLARRAGRLDLIDIDGVSLERARRRCPRARPVRTYREDVTDGEADAVLAATRDGHGEIAAQPPRPMGDGPYEVIVADLVLTQLLYPALVDEGLAADAALLRHGQPLTDRVARRLHASAPHGKVVFVHDVLGWWDGHEQPFALEELLSLAAHDPDAALARVATANGPWGCDPRLACRRLGCEVVETAFWRWPFNGRTDYLVCATVARGPAASA